MSRLAFALIGSSLSLAACGSSVSAKDACAKLEAAGVGSGCRAEKPGGLGGGATEKYVFDLVSVPGKTGQVLKFATGDELDVAVAAFRGASILAGPHRYESKRAKIFVQLNSGASAEVGAKTKAIVDGL